MRTVLIGPVTLRLAACSKAAAPPSYAVHDEPVASQAEAAPAADAKFAAAAPVPVGPSTPQLAYAYTAEIEAPAAAVPLLAQRHAEACRRAGPAVCLVTAAAQKRAGREEAHAELALQAEPGWLQRFRDGLERDVAPQHGRVTGGATTSEDLTRSLVDTEAALRAKTLLQSRLEQLLATRPGKVEELLKVEQELSRVQGEIDAARSELAVMRGGVAMSRLTLSYDSRPPLADPGAWRPLAEALRGAVAVFATSLGALVSLLAAATPFALLAAAATAVWRARRRNAASRPPRASAEPQPPSK